MALVGELEQKIAFIIARCDSNFIASYQVFCVSNYLGILYAPTVLFDE